MAPDALSPRMHCLAALLAACLVCACAAPAAPPPAVIAVPPAPAPAPPPAPVEAVPATEQPGTALLAALTHLDRVRTMPAPELTAEIARLGESPAAPLRQMQLALALLQTQVPADGLRAQALLQRVLSTETADARPLHPLARLVATQYGAQRRAEELAERQGQQLRDAQRRNDQLSERLEALRAIERSMPTKPR